MNRRDATLVSAALAAGCGIPAARAQQPGRTYRIGWLSATTRNEPYAVAMVQRLAEMGFVEGRNLVIEFRTGPSREEVFLAFANELARLNCDLYFAPGNPIGMRAVLQATRDAPVFTVANDFDLVATGYAASLARPGGRVTGVSQLITELPAKRLDVARELVPRLKRVAVLADPVTEAQLKATREAAARLGLELVVHAFTKPPYDLAAAFARFTAARAEVMVKLASGFLAAQRKTIVDLALRHHLPAVYPSAAWAEVGGLLSYGPNFTASYRRAGEMVAALLNGANPAETPIEQASVIEMVVNLKVARALGLMVPQAITLRADRVIE